MLTTENPLSVKVKKKLRSFRIGRSKSIAMGMLKGYAGASVVILYFFCSFCKFLETN